MKTSYAQYSKLRDGSWGVRAPGTVTPGDGVTVKTKAGEVKTETVCHVLWTGKDKDGSTVSLCSVEQRQHSHSSGGFCRTCGHDADMCADMDCTCHACGGMMR